MKIVDLHVHSTASDGTFSPKELVLEAKKAGLSAFALTDHDTVAGVYEAVNEGYKSGIEVIPGIEMSTSYKDKEIHIVGLFIDYQNPDFLSQLGDEIQRRNNRNLEMVKKFNDFGFPVSIEELNAMFPNSVITRAHFASFLHKKGYVSSIKEAFDKYLGDNMPLYVPREKKSPQDAIKLINNAHGVAILAHPLLYHLTMGELLALCTELKASGLCGIESMYSTYKGFDEITVRKLAHETGLLESGGSDFHGNNKPHIRLGIGMGSLMISYDFLEKLKAYRNQRDN